MERYDVVFIVLTYRSSKDIEGFCQSVLERDLNARIVVVDAFYSKECSERIKNIARRYEADYLSVENNGYSFGNNRGIEYAVNHYSFDFLIVSNPDIEIVKMELNGIRGEPAVFGVNIVTTDGRRQNPFRVRYSKMGEFLNYIGYKFNVRLPVLVYSAFNKLSRTHFLTKAKTGNKKLYPVYSVHGAFVIFAREIIKDNFPIYNEKMFLFGEEDYLAYMMKKKGVPVYYTERIEARHKEDGSVGISNVNTFQVSRKSYMEYYKNRDTDKA